MQDEREMRALIVLLIALGSFDAKARTVSVYLYHIQPPFVLNPLQPNTGLAVDLVKLLNQSVQAKAKSKLRFKLELRPRTRLNYELKPWLESSCQEQSDECDSDWLVLFVTPKWGFGAHAEQRFGWVKLFDDADLVISPMQNKVDYQGLSSFQGKIFGAVSGHKLPDELQRMFDSGASTRHNVSQVHVAIERLLRNRIDVSIIQQSHFKYLIRTSPNASEITNHIYVADQAFSQFTLQVMLPLFRVDLKQRLENVIASDAWCKTLQRYQLSHPCHQSTADLSKTALVQ